MRLFGLKSCDTCRKALKSLAQNGVIPAIIDVRADGLAADDIADIARIFGDRAINRASTTWRGLSDAERALPVAQLLAAHPTVMKRPVIDADGAWHIGWSADVQGALIG